MSLQAELKRALTAIDLATRAARQALEKESESNGSELAKVPHEIDDAKLFIRRAIRQLSSV